MTPGADSLAARRVPVFYGAMRIGVISDTHGLLRPEAKEGLAGVDHIIHAGDIGSPEIVPRLRTIAPTTAIRGNVDTQPWASAFPDRTTLVLADRSIHVLHDVGDLDFDPPGQGIAIIIAGHSHRPKMEDRRRRALPQPGQRRASAVQATNHAGDDRPDRQCDPARAPRTHRLTSGG